MQIANSQFARRANCEFAIRTKVLIINPALIIKELTLPNQAKREDDLLTAIEKWKRDLREVEMAETAGGDSELPPQYKLAALKRILVGRVKDHIRFKEAELDAKLSETGQEKHKKMYEEIEKEVYGYVKILRLESKHKEDAMDIDGITESKEDGKEKSESGEKKQEAEGRVSSQGDDPQEPKRKKRKERRICDNVEPLSSLKEKGQRKFLFKGRSESQPSGREEFKEEGSSRM